MSDKVLSYEYCEIYSERGLEQYASQEKSLKQIREYFETSGMNKSQQEQAIAIVKEKCKDAFAQKFENESAKLFESGKNRKEIVAHFKQFPYYEDFHDLLDEILDMLEKN